MYVVVSRYLIFVDYKQACRDLAVRKGADNITGERYNITIGGVFKMIGGVRIIARVDVYVAVYRY